MGILPGGTGNGFAREMKTPDELRPAVEVLCTSPKTRNIDVAKTIAALQEKHNTVFGNGYGKLKQESFRIAHMGDITLDDVKEVTGWIDDEIN